MSIPVPLGVRFFSVVNPGERWVTRFVDDLTFRSVIPGGFASATITLRVPRDAGPISRPDPLGFSSLVGLFNRIQIVDLRSLEVAWEGRIEDPARQVDPDTWQIGALGSMVAATDIQRPVFYVNSNLDGWTSAEYIEATGLMETTQFGYWQTSKDDTKHTLKTNFRANYNPIDAQTDFSWRWDSHGYDQAIARFTTTHDGIGPNSTQQPNLSVILGISANAAVDVTAFTSAELTKINVIGTDFTDQNVRYILVGDRYNNVTTGGYLLTGNDNMQLTVRNPKILGMRQNRNGTKLTTAANYTTDYVTVAQVVEDVLGRFLVAGWYELGTNTPWPGSVRPTDAYIDATDTTQILHLTYPDGATAADILTDMATQVQTNAYWAIWESAWKAGNPNTGFGTDSGYRFEWATWPNNWGYLATSQDGLEEQPNGDDVYNFIFYRYPDSGDGNQPHVTTTWLDGSTMSPELLSGGFTRAITVNKSDPTSGGTAGSLRNAYITGKRKVLNTGTLTVQRPIQLFDAGTTSSSGASRLVDPWMLRPGKLIRITDLPPRSGSTDMAYGSTAPTQALDGTIFKVVATDYSSSDNSCRLSLDQVTRWQIPTQITKSGGAKTIRIQ